MDVFMTEKKQLPLESTQAPALNESQQQVYDYLKGLRFKKHLLGGVQEMDVWRKIDKLNSLYAQALAAERARYDALLEQQKSTPLPPKRFFTGVKHEP